MPIRAILVSMRYSLYLVFNMNKALCSLKKGYTSPEVHPKS